MSDKPARTESALQAWASTVMAGTGSTDEVRVGEGDRAPCHAQYDPADVITGFMTSRDSGRQRHWPAGPAVEGQPP